MFLRLGAGSTQNSGYYVCFAHIVDSLSWSASPRFVRLKLTKHRPKLRVRPHLTLVRCSPSTNNKDPVWGLCYLCLGAGSNRRPLPLQGNALPTELPKQVPAILACLGRYFNLCREYVRVGQLPP